MSAKKTTLASKISVTSTILLSSLYSNASVNKLFLRLLSFLLTSFSIVLNSSVCNLCHLVSPKVVGGFNAVPSVSFCVLLRGWTNSVPSWPTCVLWYKPHIHLRLSYENNLLDTPEHQIQDSHRWEPRFCFDSTLNMTYPNGMSYVQRGVMPEVWVLSFGWTICVY